MIKKSLGELVATFQQGSREAFAELVSRYQNLVTSVAYSRTGDLQRSEDIAQQAFLIAWQKKDQLENPDRFGAWLRGIASNLALNEVRLQTNRQRKTTKAIDSFDEPAFDQSADSPTIQSEQNELLWSTLEKIPENYREPIILFYREGQSVAAVAEQLDLSEDAVRQRLSRGRAMMKTEIEDLVENMLFETRPQEAFSASVMSVLTATATNKIATIAATKAGATAGSKTLLAKFSAGLFTGASAGFLGAMFGMIAGIGGAWIGTRQGMKHATSQEEKDLHQMMFAGSTGISVIYTIALLVLVFYFRDSVIFTPGMILIHVGFILSLFGIVIWFVIRQNQLHKIHGKPEIYSQQKIQKVTPIGLRVNALGSLLGMWLWLIILMIIVKAWAIAAAALVSFVCFSAYAWFKAPLQEDRIKQTNLAGNLCLGSAVLQGMLLTAGYLFDLYGTAKQYDGIPFWLLAIGVPVLGLLLSYVIKITGRSQHEAAMSNDQTQQENP